MAAGVALLGYGAIADFHAESFAEAGAPVRIVAGPSERGARDFAARHGIRHVTGSVEAASSSDEVAIVVVASPSPLHADQARNAIRNGKHVLAEIPLALSLAEGEELVDLADRHGVLLGVCHTQRFGEPFLVAQDALASAEAPLTHVVARQLMLRRSNVGWTGRQRSWTDDLLWHHGGHVIDLALAFLGSPAVDVSAVVGRGWTDGSPPMDYGIGLRTQDGAIATIALSYHATMSAAEYLLIGEADTLLVGGGRVTRSGETLLEGDAATQMRHAVAAQDAAFIDTVRAGGTFPVEGRATLPTLRVQDAVQRAARVIEATR
jgi:2-hydroxy-4-carboxymuconate semialdehyde hemiacetal dehydrogenase